MGEWVLWWFVGTVVLWDGTKAEHVRLKGILWGVFSLLVLIGMLKS